MFLIFWVKLSLFSLFTSLFIYFFISLFHFIVFRFFSPYLFLSLIKVFFTCMHRRLIFDHFNHFSVTFIGDQLCARKTVMKSVV